MPSLNQGAFIEKAILSVLNQDANVELIVIDGGSSDESIQIIKKYASRLAYWVSEKDSGQSQAINKGFRKSRGEIVTWLNSDDVYEENALQFVSGFFEKHPEIQMLHGNALLFGRAPKQIVGPGKTLERWEYLPYMRFPQPSAFFRRSLLEDIFPLNEHLHYAMDHELVAKATLLGAEVRGVNKTLSKYRLHKKSKSMNEARFMEEWSQVFANVLSSVGEGKQYLETMFKLSLAGGEGHSTYTARVNIRKEEIKSAVAEHLHLRLHGFYRQHDKKKVKELAEEIKRIDPGYAEKKAYGNLILKMRLVPRFVHNLYRAVKR